MDPRDDAMTTATPWTEAEEQEAREWVSGPPSTGKSEAYLRRALATLAAVRQERDALRERETTWNESELMRSNFTWFEVAKKAEARLADMRVDLELAQRTARENQEAWERREWEATQYLDDLKHVKVRLAALTEVLDHTLGHIRILHDCPDCTEASAILAKVSQ